MNLALPACGLVLAFITATVGAQVFQEPPAARVNPVLALAARPPATNEVMLAADSSANPSLTVVAPVQGSRPTLAAADKPRLSDYQMEIFAAKTKALAFVAAQPRPKLSSPTLAVPPPSSEMSAPPAVPDAAPVSSPAPRLATASRSENPSSDPAPAYGAVPPPNPDIPLLAATQPRPGVPPPGDMDQPKPLLKPVEREAVSSTQAAKKSPESAPAAKPEKPAKAAKTKPDKKASTPPKLVVNLDNELGGQVVFVEDHGRFVILNFPLGQMPKLDSRMVLYRHGIKSATIKVTGPQRDDTIAADVIEGSPIEGDSAREE